MMNQQNNPKVLAYKWMESKNEMTYFITLYTHNKAPYFGAVVEGKMELSPIGELAHNLWLEITEHFEAVRLMNFVVMPDHLHAILVIDKKQVHNLEQIIGAYKSAVARYAKKMNNIIQWQKGFFKHLVKEQKILENIAAYIEDNPKNWKQMRA